MLPFIFFPRIGNLTIMVIDATKETEYYVVMKDMECAKSGNTLKEPWTKSRLAVCCRPQDEILCIFFTEAQLKWWKIAFGSLKWWVFRWLVLVGLGNHAGRTVSQPPSTNSCFTIGSEFKVYLSEAAAAAERAHFPVSHIMTTTTTELVGWLPDLDNSEFNRKFIFSVDAQPRRNGKFLSKDTVYRYSN